MPRNRGPWRERAIPPPTVRIIDTSDDSRYFHYAVGFLMGAGLTVLSAPVWIAWLPFAP